MMSHRQMSLPLIKVQIQIEEVLVPVPTKAVGASAQIMIMMEYARVWIVTIFTMIPVTLVVSVVVLIATRK